MAELVEVTIGIVIKLLSLGIVDFIILPTQLIGNCIAAWNTIEFAIQSVIHSSYPNHVSAILLNRKLFVTTITELSAMAAPAIIGSSSVPVNGYKAPAATGIAMML